MKPYQYATAGDGYQHLLIKGAALCGKRSDVWHEKLAPGPFPGIPLCDDCARERKEREAEAKRVARAAEIAKIRTYWLQERN